MSPEEELSILKRSIVAWSKSATYEEACRNWARIAKIVGIEIRKRENA